MFDDILYIMLCSNHKYKAVATKAMGSRNQLEDPIFDPLVADSAKSEVYLASGGT
jgi:hypothetical protein